MKVSCLSLWKVRELDKKTIITRKARRTKFRSRGADNEYQKLEIEIESLEIDEHDITLGVIRQKVLHHAEDSL